MGLDKGLAYVNSLDGVEAVFVKTDGTIVKSDNVDKEYQFKELK